MQYLEYISVQNDLLPIWNASLSGILYFLFFAKPGNPMFGKT
jgi:hypothetical protein